MSRYLVIELRADNIGHGEHADVELYETDDVDQAEALVKLLNENAIGEASTWGGYPGHAWWVETFPGFKDAGRRIRELQAEEVDE